VPPKPRNTYGTELIIDGAFYKHEALSESTTIVLTKQALFHHSQIEPSLYY